MINALISRISTKSIQDFVRSKNSSFREMKEDLSEFTPEGSKFFHLYMLGEIGYDNLDTLLVFSCEFDGELSSRSSKKIQFEIAKKVLKEDFKDGAVFVFYDKVGKFRFSFIRRNYGDKEHKYSNWKRYTYFVDPLSQTNRTFKERIGDCRFDSLENIQEAFSIEPLSKEFFNGYKEQYEKFCNYMQKDKQMQENFAQFLADGTNKAVRDYIKKMLGRIVFLHFLQKKGWMGVSKESEEWIGGDRNFLENLFKNSSKEQKDNFLDEILEPMFFNSLNKPRKNDLYDTKTSLGTVKIPYLNGGLFDKDKLDEPDSKFPAPYFKELFDFFNQYNFTIDENDPNDAEVGVDPEMLGRIFENLLEDNKDKGAFYTPKEIVHYMCQESLKEYLCNSLLLKTAIEHDCITKLLKYHDITHELRPRLKEINSAIDDVKICDPAIGSGAFPMGLLKEVFSVKQTLWLYEHGNIDEFPASEVKLKIIQNSIYGVDIEKGAVDIARLRFWLSLVVDKEQPEALPNFDYKIMCGDSLISRFPLDMPLKDVFAEYNKGKREKFTLQDYKNLVNDYTNVHEGKEQFRAIIEEIKSAFKSVLQNGEIIKRQKKESEVLAFENIDIFGVRKADHDVVGYKKAKLELEVIKKKETETIGNKLYSNSFEWRFEFPSLLDDEGNFNGFDIVIGNPPYVSFGLRDVGTLDNIQKEYLKAKYPNSAEYKISYYALFMELSIKITNSSGVLSYIVPDSFLLGRYFSKIRGLILKSCKINFNNLLVYKVFGNATVGFSVIYNYQKSNNNVKNNLICNFIESREKFISNKYNSFTIPQSYYESVNYNRFRLFFDKNSFDLVQKIESNASKLGSFYKGRTGIRSKIGQKNIVSKERKVKTYQQGIISSSQVKNYEIIYDNDWINIDANILNSGGFEYEVIHNPKIFIPQTGDKITAAIDKKGYYHLNNVHSLAPLNSIYSIEFICAFLNSKLLNWFYKKISLEENRAMAQVDIETVELFPITHVSDKIQKRINKLVDSIGEMKMNGNDAFELEDKIDIIIYKLYSLTYDEVLTIDNYPSINKVDYDAITLD